MTPISAINSLPAEISPQEETVLNKVLGDAVKDGIITRADIEQYYRQIDQQNYNFAEFVTVENILRKHGYTPPADEEIVVTFDEIRQSRDEVRQTLRENGYQIHRTTKDGNSVYLPPFGQRHKPKVIITESGVCVLKRQGIRFKKPENPLDILKIFVNPTAFIQGSGLLVRKSIIDQQRALLLISLEPYLNHYHNTIARDSLQKNLFTLQAELETFWFGPAVTQFTVLDVSLLDQALSPEEKRRLILEQWQQVPERDQIRDGQIYSEDKSDELIRTVFSLFIENIIMVSSWPYTEPEIAQANEKRIWGEPLRVDFSSEPKSVSTLSDAGLYQQTSAQDIWDQLSRFEKAQALEDKGKYEEALKYYLEVLKTEDLALVFVEDNGEPVAKKEVRFILQERIGRCRLADKITKELMMARTQYQMALNYFEQGDLGEAKQQLKKAFGSNPFITLDERPVVSVCLAPDKQIRLSESSASVKAIKNRYEDMHFYPHVYEDVVLRSFDARLFSDGLILMGKILDRSDRHEFAALYFDAATTFLLPYHMTHPEDKEMGEYFAGIPGADQQMVQRLAWQAESERYLRETRQAQVESKIPSAPVEKTSAEYSWKEVHWAVVGILNEAQQKTPVAGDESAITAELEKGFSLLLDFLIRKSGQDPKREFSLPELFGALAQQSSQSELTDAVKLLYRFAQLLGEDDVVISACSYLATFREDPDDRGYYSLRLAELARERGDETLVAKALAGVAKNTDDADTLSAARDMASHQETPFGRIIYEHEAIQEAKQFFDAGEQAKALRRLDWYFRLHPQDQKGPFRLTDEEQIVAAGMYEQAGRYDEAIGLYRFAMDKHRDRLTGRYDKMLKTEIVEHQQKSSYALFAIAELECRTGDYLAALRDLKISIAPAPGMVHFGDKTVTSPHYSQWMSAQQKADTLALLQTHHSGMLLADAFVLAGLYEELGELAIAQNIYTTCVDDEGLTSEQRCKSACALTLLYLNIDDPWSAKAALDKACSLQLDSDEAAPTYKELYHRFRDKKRTDQADICLQSAFDTGVFDLEVVELMGLKSYRRGDLLIAKQCFVDIARHAPAQIQAIKNVGVICNEQGDYRQAKQSLFYTLGLYDRLISLLDYFTEAGVEPAFQEEIAHFPKDLLAMLPYDDDPKHEHNKNTFASTKQTLLRDRDAVYRYLKNIYLHEKKDIPVEILAHTPEDVFNSDYEKFVTQTSMVTQQSLPEQSVGDPLSPRNRFYIGSQFITVYEIAFYSFVNECSLTFKQILPAERKEKALVRR